MTGHGYYYFDGGQRQEIGKLEEVGSRTIYKYVGANDSNSRYDCSKPGSCRWSSTKNVYVFNESRNRFYFVSLSPNVNFKFEAYNKTTGQVDTREYSIKDNSFTRYGVTIYYSFYSFDYNSYPFYFNGLLYSYPNFDLYSIAYLFSESTIEPTVTYVNNFNINNIHSSSSNVTITNIYYNETTNNITINNNGTQEPIDDNVQGDVVAPTVPNIKPYDVVVDLNNIDTINNYHNTLDTNINDFLVQFNDNLNKIDTNCFSLTSCAINGLKSVGNAVNDITGYSEKGMNSDIVLLICLFLLLGILFTIL